VRARLRPGLRRLLIASALAPVVGALALVAGCGKRTPPAPPAAAEPAPDFRLALFDGGQFRLSDHRGRVVVVNFFASWCVTCGEEAGAFAKTAARYATQPVDFVAVAVDDTETKARQFLRKAGLTIPAGLDRSGTIKEAYGIYGMPMTFFIDKAGMVSYVHAGGLTEQLLGMEIDKVLR
jgi:cytochrome c biogenesis protein CcmG/thiol:disulfide interchange protein DsbE